MPHPTTMLVVPAVRDGRPLRIADPQSGQYLPATGAVVPRSAFWLRRLKAVSYTHLTLPTIA